MNEPVARVSRHRLLVALGVTVVAIPVLVLGGFGLGSNTRADSEPPTAAVTTTSPPPKGISLAPTEASDVATDDDFAIAATTPTTRAVSPAATVLAVEEENDGAITPSTAPPPTRTRAFEEGQASWSDLGTGMCHHRTIAFDTVIRVTNTTTGTSATCTVSARGPYVAGRIVELDRSVFSEIAPTNAGIVTVRLEW